MRFFHNSVLLVALLLPSYLAAQPSADGSGRLRRFGLPEDLRLSRAGSLLVAADPGQAEQLLPPDVTRAEFERTASEVMEAVDRKLAGAPAGRTLKALSTELAGKQYVTTFALHYNGIPVRDRYAHVQLGAQNGKVVLVRSNLPTTAPPALVEPIGPGRARELALGVTDPAALVESEPKLLYAMTEEGLTLAYDVTLREQAPVGLWRVTIDAESGAVLEKKDLILHHSHLDPEPTPAAQPAQKINGRLLSRVLFSNPFDTLRTIGVPFARLRINGVDLTTDSAGNWTTDVTGDVRLTTSFSGPYHKVVRQDGGTNALISDSLISAPYQIVWDDNRSALAERDAYHSVSFIRHRAKLYDPTFTRIDNPITVNVNINSTCNAYYDPGALSLNFFQAGGGCSNTAQIADVVFHEFGHRINHARYQTEGKGNMTDGSLNEGFADIHSAFLRDDPRIGRGFTSSNSILRTCKNTKKWPKNLSLDPHANGEIVAGAIWDLRLVLGLEKTEALFHDALKFTPDGTGSMSEEPMLDAFLETLAAMLSADDDDNNLSNGTPNMKAILEAFEKHNISIGNSLHFQVAQIPDQDTLATEYQVTASLVNGFGVGAIDESSVKVYFSTDGVETASAPLFNTGGTRFTGFIPKQHAGSIVRYYVTGRLDVDGAEVVQSHEIATAPSFVVGPYTTIFADDAETDKGWSLGAASDRATTGLWVRAKPYGTYSTVNEFIQQDTDRTASGTMAFVTGNLNSRTPGRDDVDSGKTTLSTPVFDLSAASTAFVRYWFYYGNDAGDRANREIWRVQISSDGGSSWKSIRSTNENFPGWTQHAFLVSDWINPTATMKMRFIASDTIGALVEAGLDDFEVLSISEVSGVASVAPDGAVRGLWISPNPTTPGRELTVHYALDQLTPVRLELVNVLGQTIATIDYGDRRPGDHHASLDTRLLPPGVYWIRLGTSAGHQVTKLIVE